MTTREMAIEYCKQGWSVIPIRFDGDTDNKKRPLLDSWEPYQKQAANEAQVIEWWLKWPKANVGLVMGAVSGLVALDLDGPHAFDLLKQAKVFLPETGTVQTSRGYHALFRHPGYQILNRVKLLAGAESAVDVRGDGGYIVAPPSVHGSGAVYRWVVEPDKIIPLPEGIAALLSRQAKREETDGDQSWFDEAWRGIGEGQRNEMAARLAGYWLHVTRGNEEATYRAMSAWTERCAPPMALHELKVTIKSVARKEAAKQSHEQTKTFHHHQIVEGPEWADQLSSYRPRTGPQVNVPGFDMLGGLIPGDLILLAGRPGAGKSTLACQLSVEACFLSNHHIPTWVVSTEMTLQEWGSWMAAYLNRSGTHNLPHPLPESLLQWWKMSPISITDSGTMSIQDIRSMAESRPGTKLIIVDHATRIVGGRRDSRALEVGDVARGLKNLAKDLKCTVLSLVQLNRRVEGAETARPRLSDLRDSGELEQEADVVMFLWNQLKGEAKYHAKVPTILTVEKHRHGKTGDVYLMFDRIGRKLTLDMTGRNNGTD